MSVKVRYFASLKDRLGRSEDTVEAVDGLTVAGVWAQATAGRPFSDQVLTAVNKEYVGREAIVNDGDEVAFFPPVTGG